MPIFWCMTPTFFQHSGKIPSYCSAQQNLSLIDSLLLFLGPKNQFLRQFLGSNAHFLMDDPHFFPASWKDTPILQSPAKFEPIRFIFFVFRTKKPVFETVFRVKCSFFDAQYPIFFSIVKWYLQTAVPCKVSAGKIHFSCLQG